MSARSLRRAVMPAVSLLLGGAAQASACPSCYGRADGPLIDAARVGIWLLLGVTLCVQGGFAAFFLYLRKRAARTAAQAEREARSGVAGRIEWSGEEQVASHG